MDTPVHVNILMKNKLPLTPVKMLKPLSCWTRIYPAFANSVDPDQLASEEANGSGSALFVIQYVNLYQQPGSSNLTGWKLKVGVASKFIQHDKG